MQTTQQHTSAHLRADRLTGPRGRFRSGTVVAWSRIDRLADRWRWTAVGDNGLVEMVLEMTWSSPWPEMPDTPAGALWKLRELAGSFFHPARCAQ